MFRVRNPFYLERKLAVGAIRVQKGRSSLRDANVLNFPENDPMGSHFVYLGDSAIEGCQRIAKNR